MTSQPDHSLSSRITKYFAYGALGIFAAGLAGLVLLAFLLHYYARDLPDYKQLADYNPEVVSRVYAGNGQLVAEYARQNRIFVPIDAIPRPVIRAFLSAEDKNFYQHPGLDFTSILRAMLQNVSNIASDRRLIGASTITQQVAKNFLLTNEISIERKIKEAILAFRIERTFGKDEILELYLNEIYLGSGAYGVASAALEYFDKALDELTIDEIAYLAALPKAPNNYHPVRNHDAAVSRRNWVIMRMFEDGHISEAEAMTARNADLISNQYERDFADADYFAEEVRRQIVDMFGNDSLYSEGLYIKATLDPRLQTVARKALRDGLINYDRRHGWRGPLTSFSVLDQWSNQWQELLIEFKSPAGIGPWEEAVVLTTEPDRAEIGFEDGSIGFIPLSEMKWAREQLEDGGLGGGISATSDVVAPGDVVAVEAITNLQGQQNLYKLRQIPEVNGGLVAMDPHTGRVLALVGGYDFRASEFNRATQAERQAGSAIKPFVYLAALENGYTPATIILDAPIVLDQGPGQPRWKPSNYTQNFYGPSPMRVGIERSRNLMTVRMAHALGMDKVAEVIEDLDIVDRLPRTLSMALGAKETTLLRLSTAYAMLVNGGKRVEPTLIDRVQDRRGMTLFRHDTRTCERCTEEEPTLAEPPELPDMREQVVNEQTAYQVVSMLEGVVQRGTGRRVKAVGKPLAGKTGTTNDVKDTWFIGFSPDLVAGVYVGFDNPRSLGKRESGSRAAAPIFKDFMEGALRRTPGIPFRVPDGVRLVRMNAETGRLANPGDTNVVLEAFRPGNEPTDDQLIIDGLGTSLTDGTPQQRRETPALDGIY